MLKKFRIFIFRSEKPYDKPTNVIYIFFCSKLVVFSRKFSKTVTGTDSHKMAEISAPSKHKNFACEKRKSGTVFSNWYISVRDTGK